MIKNQAGEGWRLVKAPYDDSGLSGGTMELPALHPLLADINQGLIDVVVVYKVVGSAGTAFCLFGVILILTPSSWHAELFLK